MSKPIELTDDNLEETLSGSSVPVLVDYWAEWRGPCKMVAPVLEELAAELDGKITIGKVDVDSNRIDNWNDANFDNLPIYEPGLAEVVKDLNKNTYIIADQSYSERQLFEKAYDRLKSEFEAVLKTTSEEVQKKMDKALGRVNLSEQAE